jgi:hypothetical protein
MACERPHPSPYAEARGLPRPASDIFCELRGVTITVATWPSKAAQSAVHAFLARGTSFDVYEATGRGWDASTVRVDPVTKRRVSYEVVRLIGGTVIHYHRR